MHSFFSSKKFHKRKSATTLTNIIQKDVTVSDNLSRIIFPINWFQNFLEKSDITVSARHVHCLIYYHMHGMTWCQHWNGSILAYDVFIFVQNYCFQWIPINFSCSSSNHWWWLNLILKPINLIIWNKKQWYSHI